MVLETRHYSDGSSATGEALLPPLSPEQQDYFKRNSSTVINRAKPEFKCIPMEGEPSFTLLARDPGFSTAVENWARLRSEAIRCGDRPASDEAKVQNAKEIAAAGAEWRRRNPGVWRTVDTPTNTDSFADGFYLGVVMQQQTDKANALIEKHNVDTESTGSKRKGTGDG